jgi:hypothetical protein
MSLSGEGDVASPTGDLTQFVLLCSLSISAFVRACGLLLFPYTSKFCHVHQPEWTLVHQK